MRKSLVIPGVALAVLTLGSSLFHSAYVGTAVAQGQQGAPVQIIGPLPVPVGNTATTPLFVRDVNDSAEAPYQEYVPFVFVGVCGGVVCSVEFSPVPAGKRLMITNVSGALHMNVGVGVREIWVGENGGGSLMRQGVPARFQSSAGGVDHYAFNERVSMFSDAGHTPTVLFETSANPGNHFQRVALSGYLVRVP